MFNHIVGFLLTLFEGFDFKLDQSIILISGAGSIWLTQQKNAALRKYACFVGIVGQPFFIISAHDCKQWGMLALSIFYAYSWVCGILNFWVIPFLRGKGGNREKNTA